MSKASAPLSASNTTPPPKASSLSAWLVVLVAGIFGVLGLVDLVGQLLYEIKGAPASGTVVEFHSPPRSHTVYAIVTATPAGVPPFRWEIEDSLGHYTWEVGATVPLVCARIHADHTSCVLDSYADRFLWPVVLVAFGGGIAAWGGLRLLRRA